jgi:acetolactate synthase-1/2/3 large subunit
VETEERRRADEAIESVDGSESISTPREPVPEPEAAPTVEAATPSEDAAAEPTDEPAPTDDAAEPTDEPASTEDAAAPTDEPASTEDAAAAPTDEPAAPTDEPAAPTDEPAPTEDAAAEPTGEPAAPTDEPAAPTDEPAAGVAVDAGSVAVERAPPFEEPISVVEAAPVEPPAARTLGRFVADALRAAGVRYAFTVPGESFLGLLEGVEAAGIRIVATRHEGGAAFMAEAYGQLTGRPAAAMGTRAVGAANLSIGIHTARQDSTPMFALVGQVERAFRGREAFQEVDQPGTFGRLAKFAAEIDRPETAPAVLGEAIRAAIGGRPGPVLLSFPEDALDELVPAGAVLPSGRPSAPSPDPDDVHAVLQLLACAERPVILAGAGVLRARTSSDLVKLAEMLDVPVVASWRRADVFPNDHPLFLGMAGYGAPAATRRRLEEADGMLVIGCRLNEITSLGYTIPGPGTPWAHVDVAPRRSSDATAGAGGLSVPRFSVTADARSFIRAAVVRLRAGVLDARLVDARRAANAEDRAAWEAETTIDASGWTGPGVHPGLTIETLRRVLPDEGIVTTDAGNFGLWLARYFRFRRPGTFLGPTSGAMGYGLPAAIAAALVHRDRPVVAVAGDGGLAMTMAELETAVREGTRVVVVCFDNEQYGTIRMHQDRRGQDRAIATDLGPIDFAAVARACGALGVRVEEDAAFEPALREALAADRATVIQCRLDRRWVSPEDPPPA